MSNLRLLPIYVDPGNYQIYYELQTLGGGSPNGRYYVFEHQTQQVAGSTNVSANNNVTPYPDNTNPLNWFEDSLGGGGLNTLQTFTISPDKIYDPECQFPVIIRYGNGKDYGSQHIWQPSVGDPVVINYYPTLPAAPR